MFLLRQVTLVVIGASVAVTDSSCTADLRARLLEELKNSLKVRSFFFTVSQEEVVLSRPTASLGTLLPQLQFVCVRCLSSNS